jgi:hypothetical protein
MGRHALSRTYRVTAAAGPLLVMLLAVGLLAVVVVGLSRGGLPASPPTVPGQVTVTVTLVRERPPPPAAAAPCAPDCLDGGRAGSGRQATIEVAPAP